MIIATWNIERLKHYKEKETILQQCYRTKADIMVLTETDNRLHLNYNYCYSTDSVKEAIPTLYKESENRVSIYTNYKMVCQYDTFDPYTSICVELQTEQSSLIVYGTVMGVFGNRESSYKKDLPRIMNDIKNLPQEKNICVIGDYNCSFSDNYYYTKDGRNMIEETFSELGISILTFSRPKCIDHIAVSDSMISGANAKVWEWNQDMKLSDHKGIAVNCQI